VVQETAALSSVDPNDVPSHIAAIMDGNGRWATASGLPRTKGHEAGEEALFETVEGCLAVGVRWLTVYAFSTENWKRPKDEVKFLLNFNRDWLRRRRDELNERGVRIRFIGRRNWRVPRGVLREMEEAEQLTEHNRKLTLNIAFNYGGRAELVDAVSAIVESGVRADKVNEALIAKHLYEPSMPDPELMIRTSGESRVSNFLMWQMAYTEMIFSDVLWPDFTRDHLYGAIKEYQHRNRRFGAL
jgi:undecaprenyl diphosphate synthase